LATPPGGARAQTTSSEARHALPAPFRSRQTSPVATAETVETPRHASQPGQPVIAPGAQLDMPPGITVPPSSPPVPLLSADVSPPSHASVAEALARHRNDRTTGGRDLLSGWGWTTGSTQALVDDEDDFAQAARASRKRLVLAIGGAFGAVAILAAVAFLFSGSPPAADLQAQLGLHLPTATPPTGSTAPATAAVPAAASTPAAAPPAPVDPAATPPAGSAASPAPPPAEPGAPGPQATGEPAPAAGSAAAAAETGSAKAADDSPAPVAEATATPAPESRTRAGSAKPGEAPRPVAAATPGKAGKTSGDPVRPARGAGDATRSTGRSSAESGRSANGSARPGESGRSTSRTESSRASDTRKSDAKKVATATQKRPGSRDPLARSPGKGQPIDPYSTGASRVDPSAAYRAGLQQYAHGDTTAALSTFRTSLVANPSYAPTWRGLGLVYEKLGNKTQARAAFKRYLQLSPNAGDADQIRDRMERLGS